MGRPWAVRLPPRARDTSLGLAMYSAMFCSQLSKWSSGSQVQSWIGHPNHLTLYSRPLAVVSLCSRIPSTSYLSPAETSSGIWIGPGLNFVNPKGSFQGSNSAMLKTGCIRDIDGG